MLGVVSTSRQADGRRSTATLAADVRFTVSVLGAFTVARGDVPLAPREIGSHQGRTLLKLLLAYRGRLVATDRIAEVLWGDEPPAKWDRAVAVLVSRLRGVFGPDSIEGNREGYRFLASDRIAVDLDEAERLADESEARLAAREPALARAAAERALELLGRGPLLEDEPYAEWAEEARAAASALLRRTQRAAWRAAMSLSDYEAAAAIAEAAARADPLDEEAARAAMQALFLGGERGRALGAYDRLRVALSEALGADPAPETARLHVAMLREEPLPPLQPGPAVTRGPLDPGFVGREEELAELSRLWNEAVAGEPALVLLAGEAGIGKTRLAAEAIRLAEHTGGAVVQARCYEAERSLFLEPIVDALRGVVVSTPPDAVRALAGDFAATLGELVPEVRSVLRPMPVERASPDIERRRAFDAVTGFLRGMCLRRPVLLFLDDLHNAGTSTLELLHFLLRRAAGGRLMVMATLRLEEGDEALAHLIDLARIIEIGPLPPDAVTELARRMGVPELSERILARTGGHSLFVMETLRAISEGTPAEGDTPVPESLRDAVLARVGRAGPDVEEFLRVGAVLGSAFDLATVTELLEVTPEESARRSDRAVRARLLNEAGPAFEFANDLIREMPVHHHAPANPDGQARAGGRAPARQPRGSGRPRERRRRPADGHGGVAGGGGALRRVREPRRRAASGAGDRRRTRARRSIGRDARTPRAGPRARGARRVPGSVRRPHRGAGYGARRRRPRDGNGRPARNGRGRDDRVGAQGDRMHPVPRVGPRDRGGTG